MIAGRFLALVLIVCCAFISTGCGDSGNAPASIPATTEPPPKPGDIQGGGDFTPPPPPPPPPPAG